MLFSKRVVVYLTTLLALAASIANAAPAGYEVRLEARGPGGTTPKPKPAASAAKPASKPADKAPPAKNAAGPKKTSEQPNGQQCVKKRELLPRSGGHSDPKQAITLYHGTTVEHATSMANGALEIIKRPGDLSYQGGFYLTDRLEAAAQFACYKNVNPAQRPAVVAVLEYTWNPKGQHGGVYEFPSANAEYVEFSQKFNGDVNLRANGQLPNKPEWQKYVNILRDNAMISAPMSLPGTDKDFTPDFWQYAVIKEGALSQLTFVQVHEIKCKRIPTGQLDATRTQGPSNGFTQATREALRLDPRPANKCIIV